MKRFSIISMILVLTIGCATSPVNDQTYNLKDGVINLVEKMFNESKNNSNLKIAVLPIINEIGDKTELGYSISDFLQIQLFKRNMEIIERERIDAILEEHEFSRSGLVDENYIKKIGKMLSVDAIVTGTIRDFNENYELYVKVINIETGKVIAVDSVSIIKNDDLEKKYNTIVNYNNKVSGAYELEIRKVFFKSDMINGIAIDVFSMPDLVFVLSINDKEIFESRTYDEYPEVNVDEKIKIVLEQDDIVEIKFYDMDMSGYEYLEKIVSPAKDFLRIDKIKQKFVEMSIIGDMDYVIQKIK